MMDKLSTHYYSKNIIQFLHFVDIFCNVFNKELNHIYFNNKIDIIFSKDYYNFITKKYQDIDELLKVRDEYRKDIYKYQKATFYFILMLILKKEPLQLKLNKNYIIYKNKILTKEDIFRLIYFGFFLDELNYEIYFSNDVIKNGIEPNKINYNTYFKYLEEYFDLFFKDIMSKELNNIYQQLGFAYTDINHNNNYKDIIYKYRSKKLVLFTILRENLWKFGSYDKYYPLFDYSLEKQFNKNNCKFTILSLLQYDKKLNECIYLNNLNKKSLNFAIYFWIKIDCEFNIKINNYLNLTDKKPIEKINIFDISNLILKEPIKNKSKSKSEKMDIKLVKKTLKDFNIKDIDIVTFAKTGSTTIWETLLQHGKKYKIEHNHNLKYLKFRLDNSHNTLFIAGIRNPIDTNISNFFHTIFGKFYTSERFMKNNYVGFFNKIFNNINDINNYKFEEIKDMFFKRNNHFYFNYWFDEFFELTGLNKLPFNKKRGLEFYKLPNNNLLMLYTLEKLNDNEDTLIQFFNVEKMIKENLADQKLYKDKYDEFKSKISFSDYYKNRLLNTDLIRHFYEPKQIESFYNKYPSSNF